MEITRFEFDDPDDPMTSDGVIRLSFAPEAMVIALPNGKDLGRDDQEVMGKLLRIAYAQGRRIGIHKTIEQAKEIYRDSGEQQGKCEMFSTGDDCKCVLCKLDDLRLSSEDQREKEDQEEV